MFAMISAYCLELALEENSLGLMGVASLSLYLAMLSHYSAFLFAAALGIYTIVRILAERPGKGLIAAWIAGQTAGVALAGFLYKTHIAKLGSVYPGDPLRRFGDFYLTDVYFHAGKESLLHFLYRGTFGVFRFICGQRTAGHVTTLLFVVGVVLLLRVPKSRERLQALFLLLPFFLCGAAAVAGLYPYGRTRQCVFLAIFAISGAAVALVKIAGDHASLAAFLALGLVATSHLLAASHTLDMRAVAEQKRDHMKRAVEFLRTEVTPADVLFTDKPTSFQLLHYLCGDRAIPEGSRDDFTSFQCDGIRIIATGLQGDSLTPQMFPEKLHEMERDYPLKDGNAIWVVQAAWSRGLGEALRSESREFSGIEPRSFDYYIEVFRLSSPTLGQR
jgi:hypothetical protein